MNFKDAMSGKSMHDFVTGASPLLMAMGQGLSSGQGAFAYMPQGLAMMEQQRQKKQADQLIKDAFGGTGSPSTPPFISSRSTPKPLTPGQSVARDTMATLGKTDGDRELLAKTLMAEAGGEGMQGMLAAGAVMRNRVDAGGYGDGLRGVIMKPGQFSAWNGVTGYAGGEGAVDMSSIRPSAEAYQVADMILAGNYQDPTGGATHYYNPSVANPAWGQSAGGNWQTIGNHVFGSADAGRAIGSIPQPQFQNGMNLERFVQILQNPQVDPATKQFVLQNYGPTPRQSPAVEQEIQRYMQVFGASREEATKLASGLITEYRDPLTGDMGQFDLVTGKVWGGIVGGMQTPGSVVPAAGIQPVPAVTTETLAPMPVDPASKAQYPRGYSGDPTDAYGFEGTLKKGINAVGDALGMGTAFPEVGQIQADVAVLGENILADIAAGYKRQPPSWMLENITELTPKAGTLSGFDEQMRKANALRNSFLTELDTLNRQVERRQSPASKQEIQSKIIAIESAIGRMDAFLQSHQPTNGLSQSDTALIDRWAD